MPEFKSKEEYEKWKAQKINTTQKKTREIEQPKENQDSKQQSFFVINKNIAIFSILLLIVIITIITFILVRLHTSEITEEKKGVQPNSTQTVVSQFNTSHPQGVGKLTGNIFVTMQSGDVKKLAGIEVLLLKEPDKFISNYNPIKTECTTTYNSLRDKIYHFDSLKQDEFVMYSRQYEKTLADCRVKIDGVISQYMYKKSYTDVNGLYEFIDIPFGNYYIFSQFKLPREQAEWLTPIEINRSNYKLDLSNNNMIEVYLKETSVKDITDENLNNLRRLLGH